MEAIIIEKIKDVIFLCFSDISEKTINMDTNLKDDWGCNSIKMIQVICEIENEFDIEIEVDDDEYPIQDIERFDTLIRLVKKYL